MAVFWCKLQCLVDKAKLLGCWIPLRHCGWEFGRAWNIRYDSEAEPVLLVARKQLVHIRPEQNACEDNGEAIQGFIEY